MLIETETKTELHECPKCGKKALVARGDRFQCLWCNFTRDISEPEQDSNFLIVMIATILLVALAVSVPRRPACVNGWCSAEALHPQQLNLRTYAVE